MTTSHDSHLDYRQFCRECVDDSTRVLTELTQPRQPGALAAARRQRDHAQGRLDELRLALDRAERGGATVMRIDEMRAIVGATAAERAR